MHHIDGDIALLAGPPAIAQTSRLLDNNAGIFRDALTMKCGLCHLTLQAVLNSLAGDHALAQQHFCALDGALLDEVIVLNYKNFANIVGMIQEDDVIPPDLVMGDVAVFLSQVLEQKDRIRGTKPAEGEPE